MILVKENEEGVVDLGHLHYLWRVDERLAVRMVLGIIQELEQLAYDEDVRRARRN